MAIDNQRQQIMDSALHLLLTEGYRSMSMERLALSSEIKKSSVYHYFPSKQVVAEQALIQLVEVGQAQLFAMAIDGNPALDTQLADFCQWYVSHLLGVICLAREVTHYDGITLTSQTRQYCQLLILLSDEILFNEVEAYQKRRLSYHFISDFLGRLLAHELYQGTSTIYYGESITLAELLYQRCLTALSTPRNSMRLSGDDEDDR